jgi:cytochrome c oxidase subunit 2
MERLLGLPPRASAHAAQIDSMIALVHWLMVVLFVGWAIYFVYTLARFRRSAHPRANYHGVKSHFSNYVEIGVAVFEAVLLIGFAIPIWAVRVNAFPAEREATVVRVMARQFEWHAHYPGPDGRFGRTDPSLVSPTNAIGLDRRDPAAQDDVTTINQLHLPTGKPVLVYLTSQDVIHSFSIVQMRVKQDAIPGMEIPVWFEPTETGQYEINCSQLCGLGHYRMRGFVTIQTPEQFQRWLAEELKAAAGN